MISEKALNKYKKKMAKAKEERLTLDIIDAMICPDCGAALKGRNHRKCTKCNFRCIRRMGVDTGNAYVYIMDGNWV